MSFNPKAEPCSMCGREVEDCVCGFAPDVPLDDPLLTENEQFDLEESDETSRN